MNTGGPRPEGAQSRRSRRCAMTHVGREKDLSDDEAVALVSQNPAMRVNRCSAPGRVGNVASCRASGPGQAPPRAHAEGAELRSTVRGLRPQKCPNQPRARKPARTRRLPPQESQASGPEPFSRCQATSLSAASARASEPSGNMSPTRNLFHANRCWTKRTNFDLLHVGHLSEEAPDRAVLYQG